MHTADVIFAIDEKAKILRHQKSAVLDEVNTLTSISQQNSSSCDETNASMEEMSANMEVIQKQALDTKVVSEELGEIVSFFRI